MGMHRSIPKPAIPRKIWCAIMPDPFLCHELIPALRLEPTSLLQDIIPTCGRTDSRYQMHGGFGALTIPTIVPSWSNLRPYIRLHGILSVTMSPRIGDLASV